MAEEKKYRRGPFPSDPYQAFDESLRAGPPEPKQPRKGQPILPPRLSESEKGIWKKWMDAIAAHPIYTGIGLLALFLLVCFVLWISGALILN